jgi:hypothetical protein
MQKESPPFVYAAPEEKDILTCMCFHQLRCLSHAEFHPLAGNYIIVRPSRLTRGRCVIDDTSARTAG